MKPNYQKIMIKKLLIDVYTMINCILGISILSCVILEVPETIIRTIIIMSFVFLISQIIHYNKIKNNNEYIIRLNEYIQEVSLEE